MSERRYACGLALAVPCRQRAAQSPLWSPYRGATAAMVGRGHSRGSHPPYAYQRAEPPSRPVWRKNTSSIAIYVRLDHNASICSLARDARTTPSVSNTVAVVESQRRGDRGHGGPRSLKGESPFVCISEGGATLFALFSLKIPFVKILLVSSLSYVWPITRPYACWLATAVPGRLRAAQSPLWSYNGGASAATVGRGRSRGSRPSHAYLAGSRRP